MLANDGKCIETNVLDTLWMAYIDIFEELHVGIHPHTPTHLVLSLHYLLLFYLAADHSAEEAVVMPAVWISPHVLISYLPLQAD